MNLLRSIIDRLGPSATRERVLTELNQEDLFGQQMASISAQQPPDLKTQHPDRLPEWLKTATVYALHSTAPDSREGEQLLSEADADLLHEIGTKLQWEMASEWFVPILNHPKCDHATGWAIYHLAEPDFYERKWRASDGDPQFRGMDAKVAKILDACVERFGRGFGSRRFALDPAFPPQDTRASQERALAQGAPLHWALPPSAFEPTEGEAHRPKYELFHGTDLKPSFEAWLAENPA